MDIYIFWRKIIAWLPSKLYAKAIGVKLGENCLIATKKWSTEPYLIRIGNNVQITNGVSIHTQGGCNALRMNVEDFDFFGKVIIEDWAYIGAFSQIMPGVTIGEGAIVAAGSIVTKSVPPHSVVAGNPARVICTTEEFLNKNIKLNTHTNGLSYIKKKKKLGSLNNASFVNK